MKETSNSAERTISSSTDENGTSSDDHNNSRISNDVGTGLKSSQRTTVDVIPTGKAVLVELAEESYAVFLFCLGVFIARSWQLFFVFFPLRRTMKEILSKQTLTKNYIQRIFPKIHRRGSESIALSRTVSQDGTKKRRKSRSAIDEENKTKDNSTLASSDDDQNVKVPTASNLKSLLFGIVRFLFLHSFYYGIQWTLYNTLYLLPNVWFKQVPNLVFRQKLMIPSVILFYKHVNGYFRKKYLPRVKAFVLKIKSIVDNYRSRDFYIEDKTLMIFPTEHLNPERNTLKNRENGLIFSKLNPLDRGNLSAKTKEKIVDLLHDLNNKDELRRKEYLKMREKFFKNRSKNTNFAIGGELGVSNDETDKAEAVDSVSKQSSSSNAAESSTSNNKIIVSAQKGSGLKSGTNGGNVKSPSRADTKENKSAFSNFFKKMEQDIRRDWEKFENNIKQTLYQETKEEEPVLCVGQIQVDIKLKLRAAPWHLAILGGDAPAVCEKRNKQKRNSKLSSAEIIQGTGTNIENDSTRTTYSNENNVALQVLQTNEIVDTQTFADVSALAAKISEPLSPVAGPVFTSFPDLQSTGQLIKHKKYQSKSTSKDRFSPDPNIIGRGSYNDNPSYIGKIGSQDSDSESADNIRLMRSISDPQGSQTNSPQTNHSIARLDIVERPIGLSQISPKSVNSSQASPKFRTGLYKTESVATAVETLEEATIRKNHELREKLESSTEENVESQMSPDRLNKSGYTSNFKLLAGQAPVQARKLSINTLESNKNPDTSMPASPNSVLPRYYH